MCIYVYVLVKHTNVETYTRRNLQTTNAWRALEVSPPKKKFMYKNIHTYICTEIFLSLALALCICICIY